MARFDTNRSAEMEVFVRVVDLGGFTQAARKLRLTPSGVSKLMSRLEARLGARLVNRTTRKLTLTEEGQAFYERAVRILAEIEEAERDKMRTKVEKIIDHKVGGWGVYCYDFLLLPVAPSVSCSC